MHTEVLYTFDCFTTLNPTRRAVISVITTTYLSTEMILVWIGEVNEEKLLRCNSRRIFRELASQYVAQLATLPFGVITFLDLKMYLLIIGLLSN